MIKFLKSFFGSKSATPAETVAPYKVEAPETKVEAVNAQPVVAKAEPATPVAKAPAKKRTFVKRNEGEVKAKVAKIKAPAKPKAPRTPKAK
jgi:hypothetical protein